MHHFISFSDRKARAYWVNPTGGHCFSLANLTGISDGMRKLMRGQGNLFNLDHHAVCTKRFGEPGADLPKHKQANCSLSSKLMRYSAVLGAFPSHIRPEFSTCGRVTWIALFIRSRPF